MTFFKHPNWYVNNLSRNWNAVWEVLNNEGLVSRGGFQRHSVLSVQAGEIHTPFTWFTPQTIRVDNSTAVNRRSYKMKINVLKKLWYFPNWEGLKQRHLTAVPYFGVHTWAPGKHSRSCMPQTAPLGEHTRMPILLLHMIVRNKTVTALFEENIQHRCSNTGAKIEARQERLWLIQLP